MAKSKILSSLKALVVAAAFCFGLWQMYLYDYSYVSKIGMNDYGRQIFCQDTNRIFEKADKISVQCRGGTNRVFRISLTSIDPIYFGSLSLNDLKNQMLTNIDFNQPMDGSIILRGNEESGKITHEIEYRELLERLKELGVRNAADMYAAFGFERYEVVVPETDTTFLEIIFSSDAIGQNPLQVSEQ